ncbi:MAG: hydratase [Oscillospiraceae bacterium]|nr:hydratase [Oscillospiraceae bacterium]
MTTLYDGGVYLFGGSRIVSENECDFAKKEDAVKNTIAYGILQAHNISKNSSELKIKFDALASHDITYVGIIQTARASGLEKFPLPYVLTNCHNSLCAVGGTINEDDHLFGLSAAKKYGGIFVPAHQAVIHQYMREMMAGGGKMILGSDSHTRYGALGTMAIGEGGPELVKQLLGRTYDIKMPEIVCVYLEGEVNPGVGPQDVALEIIGASFKKGYVKNKVMEFVGPGVAGLDMDFRIGIDVMTTETTCLSSIWVTDDKTEEYLKIHGRASEFKKLEPGELAYYDGMIKVDLSKVKPMIALPFHPSNAYTIEELNANAADILREEEKKANDGNKIDLVSKIGQDGKLRVEQGVIAGCAGGTFSNLCAAADILNDKNIGCGEFSLSIYPSSQPIMLELMKNGAIGKLISAGATVRTAFCGPCFGAGDVPANGCLSIRHSTRNFPNREGSKPANGQCAAVALMDARSIAATAANGGVLTPADSLDLELSTPKYFFDKTIYEKRCYFGYGSADVNAELRFGPNIVDWPEMPALEDDILLKVTAFITDDVTTTDELIPSGETSSYRSNPMKLAEFTLSRRVPDYVEKAKKVLALEKKRESGEKIAELSYAFDEIRKIKPASDPANIEIGSVVFAKKPGDGSAREQAASCQRVLGGLANIANEYATKRYRSNLINWGMLPFIVDDLPVFENDDLIFVPDIKNAVKNKIDTIKAYVIRNGGSSEFELKLAALTDDERQIILDGCLINYYKN